MKKSLKNNDPYKLIIKFITNCQLLPGSSFFYSRAYQVILHLMILLPIHVNAQYTRDFNSAAFRNIISLKFDVATQNLKNSREVNPGNTDAIFLENYMHFIQSAIDGDDASYQCYKVNSAKRIESLRNHAENTALYFQAEINFHSSLLALYHQENFPAMKKFLQANSQMKHFLKHADNPEAGRKLQGMLLVILSAIPEEYAWITSLIGLKGELDAGITMLEDHMQMYEKNTPEYLESLIIITFIKNMFKQDYHANLNHLKNLTAGYLENPLFRLVYLITASKSGHNEEVISILKTCHQHQSEHKLCYFDYLYGEAMLNRLDKNAEPYLQSYIHCSATDIYLKSAYRKLAWYYMIQGDTLSFRSYRKKVLETGSMIADVDKQAYNEFALSVYPNIDLLKARLLFDGGYYSKAKLLLLKEETRESLKDVYQQTEYSYRLARVYHMNDETGMAVRLYQLTFKNGIHYPFYYAVFSALQLGAICEKRGDTANARLYYQKALEIPEGSYGFRFHHSAREGIRRLDKISATQ